MQPPPPLLLLQNDSVSSARATSPLAPNAMQKCLQNNAQFNSPRNYMLRCKCLSVLVRRSKGTKLQKNDLNQKNLNPETL
jgi:hypothetical protein